MASTFLNLHHFQSHPFGFTSRPRLMRHLNGSFPNESEKTPRNVRKESLHLDGILPRA